MLETACLVAVSSLGNFWDFIAYRFRFVKFKLVPGFIRVNLKHALQHAVKHHNRASSMHRRSELSRRY